MADYRQSCSNPACSYTGFSGHSPGCPVPAESRARERERQEKRQAEDKKWNDFFASMSDEEVFSYIQACENELARVVKYRKRRDRGMDYLRSRGKAFKYIDWRRNG